MSKENIEIINNLIDISKIVLPSLFTLLAGSFGYRYGLRLMKNQKRLEFVERQLREFYSPMLGCLKKIKAKSELGFEISKASNPAWQKICAEHPRPFMDHEKYFEPFKRQIIYDNKELREELIPLYDKMLAIFTENYYLAESETKNWYLELTRFIEIWHRWLSESIPAEVIEELDHKEERLKPFYQDLESQIIKLQKELSGKWFAQ